MTEQQQEHDDAISDGNAAMPPATSRTQNRIVWGLYIIAAIALTISVFALLWGKHASDDAASSKAEASANASGEAVNHAGVKALASQVRELGGTPVVMPSALPSATAPQAPTDAQVQAAVALYLTAHPVTSPVIDYTKLRAYVVAYLADHPAPAGPSGASGTNGDNGAPGSNGQNGAAGANGADASDAQVAAAVAAYLTANPPASGPPGQDGSDGASGERGQNGVDGTDGQPPVSWTYQIGLDMYECDRASPFDPTAPTYTCSVQTPLSLPDRQRHPLMWHFLVAQGVPGLVIGSLITSAVIGTWAQLVTHKRHVERLASAERIARLTAPKETP